MRSLKFFAAALILIFTARAARGVELGGEVQVRSGLSYFEEEVTADFRGRGEIELFFPESDIVKPRLVYAAALSTKGIRSEIKYMYIRRTGKKGHYTAGRQPVFWSYGSMLNLMDFRPGIEDFAGETLRAGIDGLRYHRFLGKGATLQLVVSFQEFSGNAPDELGYGSRLRLPGRGYDLSLNFFFQPVLFPLLEEEEDNLLRSGLTYSMDIGPIGNYGSFGYFMLYEKNKSDIMVQQGVDYSWPLGRRNMMLQVEYYRFLEGNINGSSLAGLKTGGGAIETGADNYRAVEALLGRDLLLASLSLQLDYFTNLGLAFAYETEKDTGSVSPFYTSQMGGGLEIRFDSSFRRDRNKNCLYTLFSTLNYYF